MNKQEFNMNWIPGLVMVAIGVAFLIGSFTDFELHNWWAYFMFIPAFGSFANAWNSYRNNGHLDGGARGSLIGGLMISLVACIFIFELSWQIMWPVGIILAGLSMMFGGFGRGDNEKSPEDIK